MSFFTSLEAKFATTESWVLGVIVKIQQGEAAVEADIRLGLAWIDSHITDINAGLKEIETVVSGLGSAGVKLPQAVTDAIKDANVAVAALNGYATSAAGGANTAQALVDGYVAAKNVAVATAAAAVAVASTPVAAPIITPTVAS